MPLTPDNVDGLKECPFKTAHKIQYNYNPNKDLIDKTFSHDNLPKLHEYQNGGYWVYCKCCYAKGPKFPDKELAIKAWNTRGGTPNDKTV